MLTPRISEFQKVLNMFEIEFEPVTVDDVRDMLKPLSQPTYFKAADPFKALRKKEVPVSLDGYAIAWMAKLPRDVQPRETGHKYARIVNRLAALSSMPDKYQEYLADLLVDRRGSRQGFPAPVARELENLQKHFNQRRFSSDPWSVERVSR